MNLNINTLRENYLENKTSIREVISYIQAKIEETKNHNIWIYTLNENELDLFNKLKTYDQTHSIRTARDKIPIPLDCIVLEFS